MAEQKTFQTFDEIWAELKEKYPEGIAEAERIKEEMEKEEERKRDNILKRHDSCKTCGHLFFGNISPDVIDYDYYCEINYKKIEYPREMGGISKCPCYMTKAEYRRANAEYKRERKKRAIDNHVYPQKPEIKKEMEK